MAEDYGRRMMASLIPEQVLKSISRSELADRLAYAQELSARASAAETPPTLRTAYKLRAQAVLRAQPRAVTEGAHRTLIAKAATVRSPAQAEAIRRKARELIEEEHPPAPRRWDPSAVIRKAKADKQLMACFDNAGHLWGVCDPDDVQVVEGNEGDGTPPAQPVSGNQGGALPADGSQVAKAKGNAGMKAVFDQQGRLLGIIDPDDVTPVITTLPGATEAIAKARARWAARAQRTPVTKAVPAGHVAVYDQQGRFAGYVRPEDLTDPASAQARNRGPVNAGGTTGMGQPRGAGPAAALPADGPQQARPGDVPGRQVVKAAAPAQAPRRRTGR